MGNIKSLYGLGAKHKKELVTAIKELEEEHDREAKKATSKTRAPIIACENTLRN